MRLSKSLSLAVLSSALLASVAAAAPPVRITSLRTNNSPIYGGSSQATNAPIECLSFEGLDLSVPTGARPQLGPVMCTHVIDSSSPLLFRAAIRNEAVTATFQLYQSTASTTPIYTVELRGARITSLRNSSPVANGPATESFELTFTEITVTSGGTTWNYSTTTR